MITEYLSYRDNLSVGDVLDDLRANAERYRWYDVQYAYVVSHDRKARRRAAAARSGAVVAARSACRP